MTIVTIAQLADKWDSLQGLTELEDGDRRIMSGDYKKEKQEIMEVGGEQLDQSEARVRVWLTAVKQRQGCQAGRKAGGNTVIKLCK